MRCRSLPCLLLALWPLLSPRAGAAQAAERVGEVLRVRQAVTGGDAKDEKSVYATLQEKNEIFEGMRVIAGPRAGASILFDPKEGPRGLVQLGSNTSLTFAERTIGMISDTLQGVWNIRVDVGRLLAMFSKKGAPGERRVKISTPNGLVTLRGTAVYLDVAQDGSTLLTVLEGSATVGSKAGGEVPVSAGQQTYIAAGQAPTTPVSFNVSPGGGLDLRSLGDAVLLEPPLIDLDDPRLNLPK